MNFKDDEIKKQVRDRYARAAATKTSCCSPSSSPCGCGKQAAGPENISRKVGYSPEDLASIPADADLGLGCGNPTALADLKTGEVVLDLGSGAGIDCFLAAERVGSSGRVIGVDMTPEMLDRARENAQKSGLTNIEFRLGEIEHLPVADCSIDAIISNCVINLSTDKPRVFREALRVLRPGGRLMVSDLVLQKPLPPAVRESVEAYTACIAGAMLRDDYLQAIGEAGFTDIAVVSEKAYPVDLLSDDLPVLSLGVKAFKPPSSRT